MTHGVDRPDPAAPAPQRAPEVADVVEVRSRLTAVATVLGYRLLTVWVPLVPGALVCAVLLRRHVL